MACLHRVYNFSSKNHFKTIYNKFRYWSNLGIFKNTFLNSIGHITTNCLIRDATSINNKQGVQNIGINPEQKKYNYTKLSAVCTKDKKILSVVACDNNKFFKKRKTIVHELKVVKQHMDNIKNIKYLHNNSKYFRLIGDKGYVTKDKYSINHKNIHIITKFRIFILCWKSITI